MIASALPDTIPAAKDGKKIRLYVIPEPVKVAYAAVREQVPPLLFSAAGGEDSKMRANFDVVLHMGVSHAKGYYEMETRAFRDDYQAPDVDGHTSAAGFASWRDEGAPEMLPIGFDAHEVLSDWKKNAKVGRGGWLRWLGAVHHGSGLLCLIDSLTAVARTPT
jgi:hypothetical protein